MLRLLLIALLAQTPFALAPIMPEGTPFATAALADDDWDDDDWNDDDDDWDDDDRRRGWDRDDDDDDDDDDDRPRRFLSDGAPPSTLDFIPGEVIVGPLQRQDLTRLAAAGFEIIAEADVDIVGALVARIAVPGGSSAEDIRARIAGLVPTAIATPNHLYRPMEMPCRANNCPAFEMVGWSVPPEVCSEAPTIGMIDTRINDRHPALAGRGIEIVSVVGERETASRAQHGTAIAALLVGDGTSRTPGLLPQARLIAVEAFHRDSGGDAADVFKIVQALDELRDRGVPVANLSFAGPHNELLQLAVSRAVERGMTIVAAAGNNGPGAPAAYPAAYDGVVAVTAVDRQGHVYRQAVQGDHIAFAAPGVRLWTAASISGGRYRSGTSYATPFVTAALAAGMIEGTKTEERVAELATRSIDLGAPGRDPVFGWGAVRGGC